MNEMNGGSFECLIKGKDEYGERKNKSKKKKKRGRVQLSLRDSEIARPVCPRGDLLSRSLSSVTGHLAFSLSCHLFISLFLSPSVHVTVNSALTRAMLSTYSSVKQKKKKKKKMSRDACDRCEQLLCIECKVSQFTRHLQ